MSGFRRQLLESAHAVRAVFANPQLRKLQLAFAGSVTGQWGYLVALAVYANDHGGAKGVSAVLLIRYLSGGLTAPWLAYVADRFRRERVMLVADLSRVVVMSAMAAAAFTGVNPVIVYGLSGFMSMFGGVFRPAQAALLPLLAESPDELTAANVSSTAIESVGAFVGPALGGVLLAVTSVGWVFVADAMSLAWSACFVVQLRSTREAPAPQERRGVTREIFAGFSALAAERDARILVFLYFCQTVVAGALRVLVVVTALDLLDIGTSGLGFLNAAIGLGGLFGVGVTFALVGRKRLASDFAIGLLLIGAGLALIGVWPTVIGAMLLMGVFGIGNTLVDVSGVTLLQRAVPDEVLGRVFGALQSILVLGFAAGSLIAPILLGLIGTRASLIVVGATLPVLALLLWRRLGVIDAKAHLPDQARLELLKANPIFAPLPPATFEHLAMKLVQVVIDARDTVFRQGDQGDRFYVIEDGRCEITIDGERVADAWPGEAFGEIALLRDVPRTATVTAVDATKLLALERDEFIAAVTGYAPSREAADALIGARLALPQGIGAA